MAKHKLPYSKMNKDSHPTKLKPGEYFEAKDIKLISTDGSDAGTITPELGNERKFYLPEAIANDAFNNRFSYVDANDIEQFLDYDFGTQNTTPAVTTMQIIGHVVIEKYTVLISVGNNGTGQIWVVGGSYLLPHLLYNGELNLSLSHPIRKIISRVENEVTYKIYFTDYNNNLRQFNLFADNAASLSPDAFDVVPDTFTFKPTLTLKSEGGDFEPGLVQYAYNLYNFSGAQSKLSPLSNLIVLKNTDTDENVNISLELNAKVDTETYSNIQIYRFHYTSLDQEPTVTLIIEDEIADINYNFKDDGVLSISKLTPEEVIFLGGDPFTCKTLEVYKNRLIAANIKINNFDLEYDSRAYSFNFGGQARLDGDSTLTLNSPNDTVPKEHDCINPSIKAETDLDYRNNSDNQNPLYQQYQYQSDGITLGGEGPNVSYEIKQGTFKIYTSATSPGLDVNGGLYQKPLHSSKQKSLKRDETYRFGIRFRNNKGQYSFASWIADIRMPNQNTHPMSTTVGTEVFIHPLYVEFNVNLNSLPDDVVDYEILRVKREESDKTIVAQGIATATMISPQTETFSGNANYVDGRLQPSYCFRTFHNNQDFLQLGLTTNHEANLTANELTNGDNRQDNENYKLNSKVIQIHSPEIEYRNIDYDSTWDIRVIGGVPEYKSISTTKGGADLPNFAFTAFYAKYKLSSGGPFYGSIARKCGSIISNSIAAIPIANGVKTGIGNKFLHSFAGFNSQIEYMDSTFIMASDTNTSKLVQRGAKSIVVDIEEGSNLGLEKVVYNGGGNLFPYNSATAHLTMVDLKRIVTSQYKGNTYNARLRNDYIVVASSEGTILSSTIQAYNGDTFIVYYNLMRTEIAETSNRVEAQFKENILFLVETSINLDAKDSLEYNTQAKLLDENVQITDEALYAYNSVYSQEANLIVASSKPNNFLNVSSYPNRVISSDTKINGENIDSWTEFSPNNFMDIEGNFGPIHELVEFNNSVFSFQTNGISKLLLQPNVQVSGAQGVQVQLGQGTFLYDYQYISTNSGTENQFSVQKSSNGIYYYDTINNKIKSLGQGDQYISDVKGMHSWLRKNINRADIIDDNPFFSSGISTTYDRRTMEAIFTFKSQTNGNYTVKFNELLAGFTGLHSYTAPMYIQANEGMYALSDDLKSLWLHGSLPYANYFGVSYNPYIIVVAAPIPDRSKVFDTITFDSISDKPDDSTEILESFRVWNSYQNSGTVPITTSNLKRRFRKPARVGN